MYEAGIYNVLGLFGCELSDTKFDILNSFGVMNIILALDSDDAGKNATSKIKNRISSYFNVETIDLPNKDIGEMSILETKSCFKDYLSV